MSEAGWGELIAPDTVRFERWLPGPQERVWSWLVEADKRALWLAGGDLPALPGEDFTLHFDHQALSPVQQAAPEQYRHYARGIQTRHRLLEYDPPHRLCISWDEGEAGYSEVTFALTTHADQVRLELTHRKLAPGDRVNVAGGWHAHLRILVARLRGEQPPAFWAAFDGIEAAYAERMVD
ncbi:MAG: SRPBCC family protein [Alcanivorax sp.]|nr:SRPBCC family protein [Alcanivorax sp.]